MISFNIFQVSRKRDYATGVDTVQYELLSKKLVTISGYECHVYNIQLYCDVNDTPWCVTPDQLKRITKDAARANSEAQKKVRKFLNVDFLYPCLLE